MRPTVLFLSILILTACSNAPSPHQQVPGPDANEEILAEDTQTNPDSSSEDLFPPDTPEPELPYMEVTEETGGPACEPGEGCFLDPCDGNEDCQSGWCVGYMGEDVCTVECQTECADGWSCQQVPGTAPDVIWLCVSMHANLCLPCAAAADCKGAAGVDDACLDYGDEGSFCGGACATDEDCPWGFSCGDAVTVDGVELKQCVADAGVCPCTSKSVALGLTTPCELTNEFGTCEGQRVCVEEGLTDCDAATAAPELCNGLDDDCDGEIDEPFLVEGEYLGLCDDGNDCTEDSCGGAIGCIHEALSEGECVDGDACTVGDHCEAGICLGSPVACDDGNTCTDDLCDGLGGCEFLANAAACDDGDPCTLGDHCQDKVCVSVPVTCDCQVDADCAALEDGDLCNGTLLCDTDGLPFQCEVDPDTIVTCPGPPPGPDELCLAAACDPGTGACSLVPAWEGKPCDDGDGCTLGENCSDGTCGGGVMPNCDDGNPCTDDGCDGLSGCQHVPNAGACDDGNTCTTGDHCDGGACVFDDLDECDDDNLCTTDLCDPSSGCLHVLNQNPCNDGDVCTTTDTCHLGVCQGAGELLCDDGNLCTDDSCLPLVGCQFTPNAAACDDGDICTEGDLCAGGWCHPGGAKVCDDGNPCTSDACESGIGCVTVILVDGTPCVDQGVDKICIAGACSCAPDCVGKVCGPDGCGGTCGSCEDDDACTLEEHCEGGLCQSTPLVCADDNLCTDDSCDPSQGCVFENNTAPCNDGNPCTTNDACAVGVCGGEAIPALAPWSFTHGGATGRQGPSQSQLDAAYAGTSLSGDVTVVGGIQAWAVPYSGTYTITGAGARGNGANPGHGALVSGDFELVAGEILYVIVGQVGMPSKQPGWTVDGCSGGGGASWVYTDPNASLPLLVAAGGGGNAESAQGGHGSGDNTTTVATGGSGASGAGGVGGNGGAHGSHPYSYTPGAGGAGWLTDGETAPTIRNPGGVGGHAPRNGGEGGYGTHDSYGAEHCSGGFGGGGAGSDNTGAGGGGGGYNGGGGGRNYTGSGDWGAGGGGGSYVGGANSSAQTGQNNGNGTVNVVFECSDGDN